MGTYSVFNDPTCGFINGKIDENSGKKEKITLGKSKPQVPNFGGLLNFKTSAFAAQRNNIYLKHHGKI
jgi:hypothetical protein